MSIDLGKIGNLVAEAPKLLAPAAGKSWFRIENSAGSPSVYLHNEIGGWGVTSADFAAEVAGLGDFDLHFNSEGGNVWQGLAIYATIQQHPGTVTGIVDGLAASAASVILCACDRVEMAKNARLMIHDAAVGYGEIMGNSSQFRESIKELTRYADFLDDTSDNIAAIYADRAGGDVKHWRAAMKKETWYSAEEAVSARLADGIVGEGATNKLPVPAPTNSHPADEFDLGFLTNLKGALA